MSVMERSVTETTLPIYHRSIDWDALYRRYPVPDVFAKTRWKWSADEIRNFQNEQFLDLMKTGWRNGFYKRRWSAAGLEPGDIKSIDDIVKLPTFDSADIKKDQEENPPFGLINGNVDEILKTQPLKLQTSGGTTGKPRPTLYAPLEWELNGLTHARVLYICGVRPGDRVQIPHTCSLGNAGWCCYKACHDYLGALPLTTGTGAVTSSRRQIEIAQEWGTNVWYVRPEYATQLAKVARDELKFDVRDLKTKFLGCGLGPTPRTLSATSSKSYGAARSTTCTARTRWAWAPSSANTRTACISTKTRPSSKSSASRTTSRFRTARSATWCAPSCIAVSSR